MKKVILTAIIILLIVCIATVAIVLVIQSHKRKTPDTPDDDNTEKDPEWQQKQGVLLFNDVPVPDVPVTLYFLSEESHNAFCVLPFFAVLDLFEIE